MFIYGGSLSYRHMCRYNSGFFLSSSFAEKNTTTIGELSLGSSFLCDIASDPFERMELGKKAYGFVIFDI